MVKPENNKIRLSLDLSLQANSILDELASEQGSTKSDILRKAIALIKVAEDARRKGQSLGVLDADKHLVSEIVGL